MLVVLSEHPVCPRSCESAAWQDHVLYDDNVELLLLSIICIFLKILLRVVEKKTFVTRCLL